MAEKWAETVTEILSTHLDSSEIYESEAYEKIENRISECAKAISGKIDEGDFDDYREARIDMESLFYKFGFMEGVRFFHKLTTASVDDLLNGLKQEE